MSNLSTLLPLVQNALIGAFMAATYATIFYVKKRMKRADDPTSIESFDKRKFAATVIVGMVVGASMSVMGIDPTRGNVQEALTTYIGAIALVESLLKAGWRVIRQR